jgi:hypothetical protein
MKRDPDYIEKILPYGELLRGFSNQTYITKTELNKFLCSRGIFHKVKEKEKLVPTMATLLLSPEEFDTLRDYQNTREDNQKKSTSRIEWQSDQNFKNVVRNLDFSEIIPNEGVNYRLTSPPNIQISDNEDRATIEFEVERHDLNKSWYEANNIFLGKVEIEKTKDSQLRIIKSYTSNESNLIGEKIQQVAVRHFKTQKCVQQENELKKILFSDFSNADRIIFFYRLSSNMDSNYFNFIDIANIEFTPEDEFQLPQDIDWMKNKTQLKLKGTSIHDTFFIKDNQYHPHIRVWEMESIFSFDYRGAKGRCTVVFGFKDYLKKGVDSEFTITLANFSLSDSSSLSNKEKNKIKRTLLDIFDKQKDQTYVKFLKYLSEKEASK